MEQFGFFDTELEDRRKEIAAHDAAIQLARNERFVQRKAVLLADTGSWDTGIFSERISGLLQTLRDAGKEAEDMHDAILAGINSAGKMGLLTDQHVAFVEQKARIEVARTGNLGQVKPAVWRERTVADIGEADFGSGQLPVAIQQAAVDRLNVLGPRLAVLGFQDDVEVNATSPKDAQVLKGQLSEVRQALMTLAPARYRHAKGHKLASADKLDRLPRFPDIPSTPSRVRWLQAAEAQKLIACLPDYLAEMTRFSLATGLRKSNVLFLEWAQVDLERKVCWIMAIRRKREKTFTSV